MDTMRHEIGVLTAQLDQMAAATSARQSMLETSDLAANTARPSADMTSGPISTPSSTSSSNSTSTPSSNPATSSQGQE